MAEQHNWHHSNRRDGLQLLFLLAVACMIVLGLIEHSRLVPPPGEIVTVEEVQPGAYLAVSVDAVQEAALLKAAADTLGLELMVQRGELHLLEPRTKLRVLAKQASWWPFRRPVQINELPSVTWLPTLVRPNYCRIRVLDGHNMGASGWLEPEMLRALPPGSPGRQRLLDPLRVLWSRTVLSKWGLREWATCFVLWLACLLFLGRQSLTHQRAHTTTAKANNKADGGVQEPQS